jgi:UDP-N-acetylglucosamine 2-epimerase (non-hydrolysing)
MRELLGGVPSIDLHEPCSHLEMLQKMRDSYLILSDSGGMQEEAPALGVPLLILRDRTERPEGIASGNLLLAGRDPARIGGMVDWLMDDPAALRSMKSPAQPYCDGQASGRIATAIDDWLKRGEPRSPSFLSETGPAEQSRRFASRMSRPAIHCAPRDDRT